MGNRSFFWSIAKDPTANTIAIAAASLVPLIGMVGGAVDASRYYMTTTRLQAACDAGALAARRAMDDDTFEQTVHGAIGNNFFDQNYTDGMFGLDNLSRTYTSNGSGEVQGAASGQLPTTLMGVFGFGDFNVNVSCSAEINISNTDVMFVLDVTGSMNCPASDATCVNNGNVEAADAKIVGLRSAVMTFYDTVDAATSSSAQVRYGIMPYSSNVNVGGSLQAAWMATDATYSTRIANFTESWEQTNVVSSNRTGERGSETDIGVSTTTWEGVETFDDCVDLAFAQHYDIYLSSDPSDLTLTSTTGTGNTRQATYTGTITWKVLHDFDSGYYQGSSDRCVIDYEERSYEATGTITYDETWVREFDDYTYGRRPLSDMVDSTNTAINLGSLYGQTGLPAGVLGQITLPTGTEGADELHSWTGCIQEASTDVGQTVFDPIPAAANDLNIDLVPSNNDEAWKPALPSAVFYRYDGGGTWQAGDYTTTSDLVDVTGNGALNCPKAAQRLDAMTRNELETYISAADGFIARGSTYHDFGMIWGGRFISPDGIFAAANATAPNGDAISRHIVFMTDGTQATSQTTYGLYGIEWWDRQVTTDGSGGQMAANHAARFQAACKAARDKNISVWVVAFGTTLTQNLIDCATPGRAYSASDDAALTAAFTEIAQKIAALRLTS